MRRRSHGFAVCCTQLRKLPAEGPFLDHHLSHTMAPGMVSHVVVIVLVVCFAVVHMALFTMSMHVVVLASPPAAVAAGRVPLIAEAMSVLSVPVRVSVRPAIKPIPFEPLVPFTIGPEVPFGVSLPVGPVSFMVLPVMLFRVAVWVLMSVALIRILVVAIPIVYMATFAAAVSRIMTEVVVIVPWRKIGTAASTLAPGLLTVLTVLTVLPVRTPQGWELLPDISNIPVSMVSVPAIPKALILVPIVVATGRVAMISSYSISPISVGAAPVVSGVTITSI